MTVNEFIKELQRLQPALREKDIVITAPNGLQFEPKIKQQLTDYHHIFIGIENIKNMIITFE
jgi:hypothetical protein